MSASIPLVDRRPIPSVAIIGNDVVLAAAPATAVQLAHACLRRGYTVAVPASWGDELVAAEAVRRLAGRERGPAVMCVCPFARSRLLAPGPDLAPFLVSLVSPPVATARYLRAVYGERGVHITYIGGCPSADDTVIDARLTPDAFLADIAEHAISLSEQPLVFDSIVPPDRRRWCSLPGGAPIAEILWSETDTRTLVEIERDDISTDLAQHIIAREHVLLDLAPSLGCVCSGAVSSLPSRSARVAVTALEPPRAIRPVIEAPPNVSLDVPVSAPVMEPEIVELVIPERVEVPELPAVEVSASDLLETRLDEVLGSSVDDSDTDVELEAELDSDFLPESPVSSTSEELPLDPHVDSALPSPVPFAESSVGSTSTFGDRDRSQSHVAVQSDVVMVATSVEVAAAPTAIDAPTVVIEREIEPESSVESAAPEPNPGVATGEGTHMPPDVAVPNVPVPAADTPRPVPEPEMISSPGPRSPSTSALAFARRRTPASMPTRHPAASIPKATASDGRALPRAYVAKRRTPPGGVATSPEETTAPAPVDVSPQPPAAPAAPSATESNRLPVIHPSEATHGSLGTQVETPPNTLTEAGSPAEPTRAPNPEPNRATGAATATDDSNPSALIVVLVALLAALGFFALRSLN